MKLKLNFFLPFFILLLFTEYSFCQYAPPPGYAGTTAIHQDSSVFYAWASSCTVTRGFIKISDTTMVYNNSNRASYGNVYMATGIPDGLVLSLGDGGIATLTFDTVISDHPGWDFAVFENSFSDGFLELAYVEVSSDGIHFARFPSVSLTQTQQQIGTFDTLDTRKINNLAGKYRLGYGTPFDLAELNNDPSVNIYHITQIRIIDVVGCLSDAFARYDSQNHKINDPWPTPFDTGGFDLDGVGLVHNASSAIADDPKGPEIRLSPNPCSHQLRLFAGNSVPVKYELINTSGRVVINSSFTASTTVDVSNLPAGVYFARFTSTGSSSPLTKKLLKY